MKPLRIYPIEDMPENTKAAWLALAIDCEGCIVLWDKTYHPRNRHGQRYSISAYVGFANDNKKLVELFGKVVGIGHIREYLGGTPRKLRYRWEFYKYSEIIPFLERIIQYLIIKQEKADILLKFCCSRLLTLKGEYCAPYTEEEKKMVEEMKKLGGA